MSRRGEKRRWIDSKSRSMQDEQRRRSPRFASATNGDCKKQTNKKSVAPGSGANNSIINTYARKKPVKRVLAFPDSTASDEDDLGLGSSHCTAPEKLVKQSPGLPQPEICREEGNGAPSQRKYTIKGKQLAAVTKENCKQDDHHDDSWLSEKRILELVLDTLQRRDTYDIFSEPVDPTEVEDYYDIIQEPMDFGTMRAKLHEGMYKNLQQFEHDTFLIFDNAMHFNPSGSVYFRQARALDELARKVFHVLKTDPENFEHEFAVTRRRFSRRVDNEPKGSAFGSGQKLARDLGSNSMSTDVDKKGGPKRRKKADTDVIDRRCTYNPWKSVLDETNSTISPINFDLEPLIHVNPESTGYIESLMLFVKDLGPTAQMVARRKLQGLCLQTSSSRDTYCSDASTNIYQISSTSSHFQRVPNEFFCGTMPTTSPMANHFAEARKPLFIQNYGDAGKAKEAPRNGNVDNDLGTLSSVNAFASASWWKKESDLKERDNKADRSKNMIVVGLLATGVKCRKGALLNQNGAKIDITATSSRKGTLLRDDRTLNCPIMKALPPPVKERKRDKVAEFDLNQVQTVSSSGYQNSSYKDHFMTQNTPSLSVATSRFSRVSIQGIASSRSSHLTNPFSGDHSMSEITPSGSLSSNRLSRVCNSELTTTSLSPSHLTNPFRSDHSMSQITPSGSLTSSRLGRFCHSELTTKDTASSSSSLQTSPFRNDQSVSQIFPSESMSSSRLGCVSVADHPSTTKDIAYSSSSNPTSPFKGNQPMPQLSQFGSLFSSRLSRVSNAADNASTTKDIASSNSTHLTRSLRADHSMSKITPSNSQTSSRLSRVSYADFSSTSKDIASSSSSHLSSYSKDNDSTSQVSSFGSQASSKLSRVSSAENASTKVVYRRRNHMPPLPPKQPFSVPFLESKLNHIHINPTVEPPVSQLGSGSIWPLSSFGQASRLSWMHQHK